MTQAPCGGARLQKPGVSPLPSPELAAFWKDHARRTGHDKAEAFWAAVKKHGLLEPSPEIGNCFKVTLFGVSGSGPEPSDLMKNWDLVAIHCLAAACCVLMAAAPNEKP